MASSPEQKVGIYHSWCVCCYVHKSTVAKLPVHVHTVRIVRSEFAEVVPGDLWSWSSRVWVTTELIYLYHHINWDWVARKIMHIKLHSLCYSYVNACNFAGSRLLSSIFSANLLLQGPISKYIAMHHQTQYRCLPCERRYTPTASTLLCSCNSNNKFLNVGYSVAAQSKLIMYRLWTRCCTHYLDHIDTWYILAMYKLTCGFSLIQPDLYQLTFLCVGRSAEFCASQLHLEQIQWRLQFDTLAYKTKVFCLNTSHIFAPPLPYCPEQAPIGACSSSAKKKVSERLHGEGSWMVQLSPCKGPPRIRESEQQRVLQNRGNYTKT